MRDKYYLGSPIALAIALISSPVILTAFIAMHISAGCLKLYRSIENKVKDSLSRDELNKINKNFYPIIDRRYHSYEALDNRVTSADITSLLEENKMLYNKVFIYKPERKN